MEPSNTNTLNALADVELILGAIENDKKPESRQVLRLESGILFVLLSVCVIMLGTEIFSGGTLTKSLAQADGLPDAERYIGIGCIFAALMVIMLALYFLAWRRAVENHSRLERVLKRNLKDLHPRGLLPDLGLKFFLLSTVIILHQTVALPALFVAFTADYVFQERFFRMPRWVGALSGAGLYAIAAVMIKFGSSDLVVPLALFAAISFISLVSNISKMRKSHG